MKEQEHCPTTRSNRVAYARAGDQIVIQILELELHCNVKTILSITEYSDSDLIKDTDIKQNLILSVVRQLMMQVAYTDARI